LERIGSLWSEGGCELFGVDFVFCNDKRHIVFSFGVVSAISGNRERIAEPAELSTSFSLFFDFYFFRYFELNA
jgi:hypothetical protein